MRGVVTTTTTTTTISFLSSSYVNFQRLSLCPPYTISLQVTPATCHPPYVNFQQLSLCPPYTISLQVTPATCQHTFTVTHLFEFSRQIDFRLCVTLSLVAVVAVEIFCLYPPDQPEGGVLELSCSKKPEYRAKKILLGMQNAYMMVPCK